VDVQSQGSRLRYQARGMAGNAWRTIQARTLHFLAHRRAMPRRERDWFATGYSAAPEGPTSVVGVSTGYAAPEGPS
jgi:hypothetical protein